MKPALVLLLVMVGAVGTAHAYPQFQLSRDQTCTACHLDPAGSGLLSENGYAVAEQMSQFGTSPDFMYGKLKLPDWLVLGGDLRDMQGFSRTPQDVLVWFPMQLDVYAAATYKTLSLHVTAGYRPPQYGNEAKTYVWSREHYLQWQSEPGNEGLYVRVGRFMPVFGLRFAEHPMYTRRFGGTPLYDETYGAALEYVTPRYEVHLTGFVRDPLIDPVNLDNGVAGYGELRLDDHTEIGAEGMYTASKDDKKTRGGIIGKRYIAAADLLLSGEVQFVNQRIDAGGAPNQLVANVVGSYFFTHGFLFDLALGYFNENLRIKNLDRDAVDGNLHWFATSHLEVVLDTRLEMFAFGKGGPTGGWALVQFHYRL
jgi:hypothetical protein